MLRAEDVLRAANKKFCSRHTYKKVLMGNQPNRVTFGRTFSRPLSHSLPLAAFIRGGRAPPTLRSRTSYRWEPFLTNIWVHFPTLWSIPLEGRGEEKTKPIVVHAVSYATATVKLVYSWSTVNFSKNTSPCDIWLIWVLILLLKMVSSRCNFIRLVSIVNFHNTMAWRLG